MNADGESSAFMACELGGGKESRGSEEGAKSEIGGEGLERGLSRA